MTRVRMTASGLLAAALALVPAMALAHTDLASSDPADRATLTEAPSEVVLTYEGEIDEASTFTVTGPAGDTVGEGVVDLDVADRNVMRGDVSIVDPGQYTVTHAIIGDDGHPIEGTLTFTYAPPGSGAGGETPNTAMAVPGAPLLSLVGVILLVAGLILTQRRRIVRS